ncbi:MAG TPA: phosphodiester glycosidase family protein [Conexibacter sp.]|jgi:exopolysaccharide biosynthesis protein
MSTENPRRWRRLAGAAGAAALLAGLPAAANAELPRSPVANTPASTDQLTLTDSSEALAPGITLRHLRALTKEQGWVDLHELLVDLTAPNVHPDVAVNKDVTTKNVLTTFAPNVGATVMVNGDFFDISGTMAGEGLTLHDGRLLKGALAGNNDHTYLATGTDGLAHIERLAVDSSVVLGGDPTPHEVATFNDAGHESGAAFPTDSIVAYTSDWGVATRDPNTLPSHAGSQQKSLVEVKVVNGTVASVTASTDGTSAGGSGAIDSDTTYLEGFGADATALETLSVGDSVSFTNSVSDSMSNALRSALGGRQQLVVDGVAQPESVVGDDGGAPRTSAGLAQDGKTLMIVTTNGRDTANETPGPTRESMGLIMRSLGAYEAINFDGGASTEMVGRRYGDTSYQQLHGSSIGAGGQRSVPDGYGLFVTPGDGTAHSLVVSPDKDNGGDDPTLSRVFPGMHRTFSLGAVDDHGVAVTAPIGRSWSAPEGSFSGDTYTAPSSVTAAHNVTVTATAGIATGTGTIRVLGAPAVLQPSRRTLEFGALGETQELTVNGLDKDGFAAPIVASDLRVSYDGSLVRVTLNSDGTGLDVSPVKSGVEYLTVSAGGATTQVRVETGIVSTYLESFVSPLDTWARGPTHNEDQTLTEVRGAGHDPSTPEGADALRLDYDYSVAITQPANARAGGIKPAAGAPAASIHGPATSLSFWVKSTTPQPAGISITYGSANGLSQSFDNLVRLDTTDWQQITVPVPATWTFPLHISSIQPIDENTTTATYRGGVYFSDLEANSPGSVTPAPPTTPVPDRLVSTDGQLSNDSGAWAFGAIGDMRYDANTAKGVKQGTLEVQRAIEQRPDFLLLDGNIASASTDTAISSAETMLEGAGCDLVPLDQALPSSTPDGTIPCLYIPGDVEWKASGTTDANGDAWGRAFSSASGSFDHKGTRFVLLNSGDNSSDAATSFDQLAMLRDQLDDAQTDDSVENVVVVQHATLSDPAGAGNQLGDANDIALLKSMLSSFHAASGKGVSMIGADAQVADVSRNDGVSYVTLPSAGTVPGGTTATGGFDGWVRFGVDAATATSDDWLDADVRAYAEGSSLSGPASVAVGSQIAISGTLDQAASLSVPIGYPNSVDWTGSDNLAIGSGQAATDAARAAGKAAILDPATGVLHGLRDGQVTVGISNDSVSGGSQVKSSKTIKVGNGPATPVSDLSATPLSFADQQAGTVSDAQAVTITSTGSAPLSISSIDVSDTDGLSSHDFQVDGSACTSAPIAVGDHCVVMVRFAPQHAGASSNAQLVIHDNTPTASHAVALSGTSSAAPRGPGSQPGGVTPPLPGHTASTPRVASKVGAQLKAGKSAVAVMLTAPKGETASGSVKAEMTLVTRKRGKSVRRTTVVGTASFKLGAGARKTLQVKLSKSGRSALAKAGSLRITVLIDTRDAKGHIHTARHTVVLHAAAAKRGAKQR